MATRRVVVGFNGDAHILSLMKNGSIMDNLTKKINFQNKLLSTLTD